VVDVVPLLHAVDTRWGRRTNAFLISGRFDQFAVGRKGVLRNWDAFFFRGNNWLEGLRASFIERQRGRASPRVGRDVTIHAAGSNVVGQRG
jgi:hypothetical protein